MSEPGHEDERSLAARFAAIAHEVGTPLALAAGAARALADDAVRLAEAPGDAATLAGPMRVHADLIVRNLERAAKLLASYKRSAAAEAAAGAALRFPLADAVRDAVETLAPALRKANVAVDLRAEEGIDLVGDPGAIAQVVVNLVLNAAHHAYRGLGAGRVEVALRREEGAAVLEVRDRGRGMAPGEMARIFEPLFTTDRAGGSTGLGLAVVRDLVERRLSGTISVASRPGEGAAFTIKLPLAPSGSA